MCLDRYMPKVLTEKEWARFTNRQSVLGRRVYGDLLSEIRYVTDPYIRKTWVYRYEKEGRHYRLVE